MATLDTKYLNLELKSPIIAAAGPLTEKLDSLKELEDKGAGAVVLKSIFEEHIDSTVDKEFQNNESYLNFSGADAHFKQIGKDYYIDKYMRLLVDAKASLDIPVIASICCKTKNGWAEYIDRFISCGADAIELNYYPIFSSSKVEGKDVDKNLIEFAKNARRSTSKPIAIKLGSKYSSLANIIASLDKMKIDGAVLFNKSYSPDIDIEKETFVPGYPLSAAADYLESLRWIGLMSGEITMNLCGNTGIHSSSTVIKMLLAGASAVEVNTILTKKGAGIITKMNEEISAWMDKKGYPDIAFILGRLAQERIEKGYEWERTQFLKMI